jgi:hypothetical protein
LAIVVIHKSRRNKPSSYIYCIMITGKSKCRVELARRSITNFEEQSYSNKRLIIINHGCYPVLLDESKTNVKEVLIDKGSKSLGYLRNLALEYVPEGDMWTTWDDDDYRDPEYLSILQSEMVRHNVSTVMFTHRFECNVNTHFVWSIFMRSGFVTLLSVKKEVDNILYTEKDTMEDLDLKKILKSNGHTFHIMQLNDPRLYIRMVHNNNTSLYVNKSKDGIRITSGDMYREYEVSKDLQKSILAFFLEYYKKGIQCMQLSER